MSTSTWRRPICLWHRPSTPWQTLCSDVQTFGRWDARCFSSHVENFERPFTPRGWLRSAWNFGKTRFRWFATFDFSTPSKKISMIFLPNKNLCKINKLVFWRSYDGLSVSGRSVVKSHYLKYPYFIDTSLGEGVNDSICVLDLDLAPKLTLTILVSWCYDGMIVW